LPSAGDFVQFVVSNTTSQTILPPTSELYNSGLGDDSFADAPARRIESMSIVVWKILRRLPKPVVPLLLIFLLTAMAARRAPRLPRQ